MCTCWCFNNFSHDQTHFSLMFRASRRVLGLLRSRRVRLTRKVKYRLSQNQASCWWATGFFCCINNCWLKNRHEKSNFFKATIRHTLFLELRRTRRVLGLIRSRSFGLFPKRLWNKNVEFQGDLRTGNFVWWHVGSKIIWNSSSSREIIWNFFWWYFTF